MIYRTWLKTLIKREEETVNTLTQLLLWITNEAAKLEGRHTELLVTLTERAAWYKKLIDNHTVRLLELKARLEELNIRSFSYQVYTSLLTSIRNYRNGRK